jgi:hypothetical protein
MKTIIATLLSTTLLALTAWAEPRLVVETIVKDGGAGGEPKLIAHVHLLTKSGNEVAARVASLEVGSFEYSVTPTLGENGTVEIRELVTQRFGERKPHNVGPSKRTAALGETLEWSVGPLGFSTKVSVEK